MDLGELMTDQDGKSHRYTLPAGRMAPQVWEKQKRHAKDVLPPQFAELVNRTEVPFVQAITDVLPSRAAVMEGTVILAGDSVAGFRPHTAGSTGQAAWHATLLNELDLFGNGKMSLAEYEKQVLAWARQRGQDGIEMGQRSQFGEHPLAA